MRRRVVRVLLSVALASGAVAGISAPPAAEAALRADALLSIDQNRTTVIERIVGEWGAPLEESGAGIDRGQLRTMLEGLRADHLLAASLAGSLTGLRDVLANVVSGDAPLRAVKHIAALGDANQDLVYTPVAPCRLFDTRVSQGGQGTPTPGKTRTYGAIEPVTDQGGPGKCSAAAGAAVALIQVGTLTPSGDGLLQGGPQGAASFPNALILYQAGDQYGTAVAMPLNPANGQFDLVEQFATADLYGDLLGFFKAPGGAPLVVQGGNTLNTTLTLGTNDNNAVEIEANGSRVMRYEPDVQSPNVIGGHPANSAAAGTWGTTVGGGGLAGNSCYDIATNTGFRSCANQALSLSIFATIGGGESNAAGGSYSTVGGGLGSTAVNYASTVGGGSLNIASGESSTVGGGIDNAASYPYATIAGGGSNVASSTGATVAGGIINAASGPYSSVAGGRSNMASGSYSSVGGGWFNTASGTFSFAVGRRAKTQTTDLTPIVHNGTFVFADSNDADFNSTNPDEFSVRATGGARFVTAIDVGGAPATGVRLSPGAGTWANASDRAAKRDLQSVDPTSILTRLTAMPIYSWRYRTEVSGALHVGPTSQDFHTAFGLGDSDKSITTIDEGGIALAAIQGMNARLDAQLQSRDAKIDAQAARIAELEQDRALQAVELADLHHAVDMLLARGAADGHLAATR